MVVWWLWTGSAEIPEKEMADVGLGLRLPIYVSGSGAVGWWAVWITMLGDSTAFASLVFGVFFYWTAGTDYPPRALRTRTDRWPSRRWRWARPPGR